MLLAITMLSAVAADTVALIVDRSSPGIDLNFLLNACYQRPVSVAADFTALDHHWFDPATQPGPIVWKNPGGTARKMPDAERQRVYVEAAVNEYNRRMAKLDPAPGLTWSPLEVHEEGTTVVRQADVPFLDACKASNPTDEVADVGLRTLIQDCAADPELTGGRKVSVDYEAFPMYARLQPQSQSTLYDILKTFELPWTFACYRHPGLADVPSVDHCHLNISTVRAKAAMGTHLLTASYDTHGPTGCNNFP